MIKYNPKIMNTETCNDILAYNNLLIQENTNLIIKKKMKIVEIKEKQRIINGLINFLIEHEDDIFKNIKNIGNQIMIDGYFINIYITRKDCDYIKDISLSNIYLFFQEYSNHKCYIMFKEYLNKNEINEAGFSMIRVNTSNCNLGEVEEHWILYRESPLDEIIGTLKSDEILKVFKNPRLYNIIKNASKLKTLENEIAELYRQNEELEYVKLSIKNNV